MRVAVIGGGINGVMAAWELARGGRQVTLFERGEVMGETSSASTKLLHGGLRYLEHGSFWLVREALRERSWWFSQAPHLCHPLRILLPHYEGVGRPRWMLGVGLWLYRILAGGANIAPHQWLGREQALEASPDLRPEGLLGAYAFWDGQMDDHKLGLWAAGQARAAGVEIREHTAVRSVSLDGDLIADTGPKHFDAIVNVAGPWARKLLDASEIPARHYLDLVRGSHLVVDRVCPAAILAEVRASRRIAFILPYLGKTLVGTTEERQTLEEPIACSERERDYLIRFHDSLMATPLEPGEICSTFAGVRPLLRSADDPGKASREYAIERQGRLVTVFGGKWTTARSLGQKVAGVVAKIA
jgi:glycerol-3-phosphate dehydrogenase